MEKLQSYIKAAVVFLFIINAGKISAANIDGGHNVGSFMISSMHSANSFAGAQQWFYDPVNFPPTTRTVDNCANLGATMFNISPDPFHPHYLCSPACSNFRPPDPPQ